MDVTEVLYLFYVQVGIVMKMIKTVMCKPKVYLKYVILVIDSLAYTAAVTAIETSCTLERRELIVLRTSHNAICYNDEQQKFYLTVTSVLW
jgi:hypothetical protein